MFLLPFQIFCCIEYVVTKSLIFCSLSDLIIILALTADIILAAKGSRGEICCVKLRSSSMRLD